MQSVFDARARDAWSRIHKSAWRDRVSLDAEQTRRIVATRETLDRQKRQTKKAVQSNAAAERKRSRSRNSLVNRTAASDFLIVGIVDELSKDTADDAVVGALEVLNAIFETANNLKEATPDPRVRSGIAGSHVWCGILANSSPVLDNSSSAEPFKLGSSAFFSSIEGRTIEASTANIVSDTLLPLLDSLVVRFSRGDLRDAVRVSATFICPAPEEHAIVAAECFIPLAEDLLTSSEFDLPIRITGDI